MTPEQIDGALDTALGLCVRFDGIRLKPYLCPAGVPTIGLGSTHYMDGRAVRLDDPPITRTHAFILAREQLRKEYLPGVVKACPGVDTPQRLAALLDCAYNVGLGSLRASTLRKRVNAGAWDLVPDELRKWNKGGGRVLPGLVARRAAEAAMVV